jgi:hypothetical protein
MQKFNGYDEAKKAAQYQGGEKLPKGAYVADILGVKLETGTNGNSDRLHIQFDIAEGEYKGFFKKQYEDNTNDDKKYKGKVALWLPKDDGSEKDQWTKNKFAAWPNALEESNEGYTWDWDETKWKGKKIGLVFGETGNVIDGKEVIYTEVRYPVSVQAVREGKAGEARFKSKNGYGEAKAANNGGDFMNIPDNIAEELPFN